jgi:hypothetical protein
MIAYLSPDTKNKFEEIFMKTQEYFLAILETAFQEEYLAKFLIVCSFYVRWFSFPLKV